MLLSVFFLTIHGVGSLGAGLLHKKWVWRAVESLYMFFNVILQVAQLELTSQSFVQNLHLCFIGKGYYV